MASDRAIYDNIVQSIGYKTTVGLIDRRKVEKAIAGLPSPRPRARLAIAAFDLARRITPVLPGPTGPTGATGTPPPTYVKVAPITVREEGGSDQRVCLFRADGTLQPGVRRLSNGQYTDESGALYRSDGDGLEDSAVRSKVNDPALVGARSMDGRSACQCPPTGDPTKNTGSWTV